MGLAKVHCGATPPSVMVLFVTHFRIVSFQGPRLIVFAFSDNLSAENYKLSAESGLPGLSFLECMHLFLYLKCKTLYPLLCNVSP